MSKKYPKTIYVSEFEESNGDKYLNAHYEASEADDGKIAIYRLEKIISKRTETILEN
jgi:hypothetical protein